jgi:uncharacterized protein involved in exopolysaccharide biosynthesis
VSTSSINSLPGDADALAFQRALELLLPHWRRLLLVAVCAAAAAGAWRLAMPRRWRSEASIIPVAAGGASSLAGVAAQFGLNVPTADPTQSPAYYVEVLRSRDLIEQLIARSGGAAALSAPFDATDSDSSVTHELVVQAVRDAIDVSADPKSGVVRLNVLATSPTLAASLAQRVLVLAQEFNSQRRQARAHQERVFATGRVEDGTRLLRTAEDRLRTFKLSNRSVKNAPALELEQARLERGMSDAQQVLVALRQLEEQSRLDELRNTPVYTVVQPPTTPRLPEGRKTVLFALLAGAAAMFAGASLIVLRTVWRTTRPSATDTLSLPVISAAVSAFEEAA